MGASEERPCSCAWRRGNDAACKQHAVRRHRARCRRSSATLCSCADPPMPGAQGTGWTHRPASPARAQPDASRDAICQALASWEAQASAGPRERFSHAAREPGRQPRGSQALVPGPPGAGMRPCQRPWAGDPARRIADHQGCAQARGAGEAVSPAPASGTRRPCVRGRRFISSQFTLLDVWLYPDRMLFAPLVRCVVFPLFKPG